MAGRVLHRSRSQGSQLDRLSLVTSEPLSYVTCERAWALGSALAPMVALWTSEGYSATLSPDHITCPTFILKWVHSRAKLWGSGLSSRTCPKVGEAGGSGVMGTEAPLPACHGQGTRAPTGVCGRPIQCHLQPMRSSRPEVASGPEPCPDWGIAHERGDGSQLGATGMCLPRAEHL